MMMKNIFNILYQPEQEWRSLYQQRPTILKNIFLYLIPLSLIPTLSAFIGSTYVGWGLVGDKIIKLTYESALLISISAYFAIIISILFIALMIKWMAKTYGCNPGYTRCLTLVTYSSTPLFLISIVALYPVLWVDTLLTIVAIAFAIRILFVGVPVIMQIEKEQGFLFASSILTVAMVLLMGLMTITVLFWGFGIAPAFTN